MLNRNDYLKYVNPERPLANVGAQVCTIERAVGEWVWRCVAVYHLSPQENGGQHIVFVDLLDELGNWDLQSDTIPSYIKVGWTWEGRRLDEAVPPALFEKKLPEFKAQVNLGNPKQITSVWVDHARVPSDKVHGLRSDVEMGVGGNSWGHNSFVVLFQLVHNDATTDPEPTEETVWVTLTAPTTIKITGDYPFTVEYRGS